jgi:bifunctional oligoribonuclease and PAP phosphatase NrnA
MQDIQTLKELLSSPKKIVITTHHKPDADALGSSLALWGFLKKKNHDVTVITPSDYPDFLNWMEGNDEVLIYSKETEPSVEKLVKESEIIFCLDFSAISRLHGIGDFIKQSSAYKVLIDHHLEPERFADFEYWFPKAAATAELIFDFIKELGEVDLIDVPIAECLYAGIMTDTGSFRHNSTSKKVHQTVAELIEIGIDNSAIHRLIFDNNSEDKLRFLGFAFSQKLKVLKDLKTAYFVISAEDLKKFSSKTGDTEGLVNFALSLENIILAAVIIERDDAVKMSFRSVGDFSVNEFARKYFEGGGHKNASGGISRTGLKETEEKFLRALEENKETLKNIIKSKK